METDKFFLQNRSGATTGDCFPPPPTANGTRSIQIAGKQVIKHFNLKFTLSHIGFA